MKIKSLIKTILSALLWAGIAFADHSTTNDFLQRRASSPLNLEDHNKNTETRRQSLAIETKDRASRYISKKMNGFQSKFSDLFKKLGLKGIEVFQKADISFSVDLINFSPEKGITLGTEYSYEVNSIGKYYQREDRWRLNGRAALVDLFFQNNSWPIFFNIDPSKEIIYRRFYSHHTNALAAKFILPTAIPTNAEKMLMHPTGTFISFPANLNIMMGLNGNAPIGGIARANGSIYYLVRSSFIVQIFRLEENKVRLKIIVNRNSGPGASAGIRSTFSLLSLKYSDKVQDKLLDPNILQYNRNLSQGDLLYFSYDLDLTFPSVKDAFNRFIGNSFKFKTIKNLESQIKEQVFQFLNRDELAHRQAQQFSLHEMVISDLSYLQQLHYLDRNLPKASARVRRNVWATNLFESRQRNLSIGSKYIFHNQDNTIVKRNFITNYDNNNSPSFFLDSSVRHTNVTKKHFGLSKKEEFNETFLLLKTDQHHTIDFENLSDLGYRFSLTQKTQSNSDQKNFFTLIKRSLIPQLYQKLVSQSQVSVFDHNDVKFMENLMHQFEKYQDQLGLSDHDLKIIEGNIQYFSQLEKFNEGNLSPYRSWIANTLKTIRSSNIDELHDYIEGLEYIQRVYQHHRPQGNLKNGRLVYEIIFKDEVIKQFFKLKSTDIKHNFKKALETGDPSLFKVFDVGAKRILFYPTESEVVKNIDTVFTDANISNEEKIKKLITIHRNPKYNKIFLLYFFDHINKNALLMNPHDPLDELAKMVQIRFQWIADKGNNTDPFPEFNWPSTNNHQRTYLNSFRNINAVIHNTGFDLLNEVNVDPDFFLADREEEQIENYLYIFKNPGVISRPSDWSNINAVKRLPPVSPSPQ